MLSVGFIIIVPIVPLVEMNLSNVDHDPSLTKEIDEKWEEIMNGPHPESVLDSTLASYLNTGNLPDDVSTSPAGDVGILMAVSNDIDSQELAELVDIIWKVNFGSGVLVNAYIDSPNTLSTIEDLHGVSRVWADFLQEDKIAGNEVKPLRQEPPLETSPLMNDIKEQIGVDDVYDLGYDGGGVRVGIIGSGIDFTHPDLVDALDQFWSDGLLNCFDPTGQGIGLNPYKINATPLDNPDAYLAASEYNWLSYTVGGKTYMNCTSRGHLWDPEVNSEFGIQSLREYFLWHYVDIWFDGTYPSEVDFSDFIEDVLFQDFELTDPSTTSGSQYFYNWTDTDNQTIPFYYTGYFYEAKTAPYMKVFAPILVLNANTPGERVVVDWNTTRSWTDFWAWGFAATDTGIDFSNSIEWDYYANMGDWSFVDDLAADAWYKPGIADRLIMAHDYDGDDIVDFGLGVLATVWDFAYHSGVVEGIGDGGRVIGVFYDHGSMGTASAGLIAGRGILEYPVGSGGTYEKLSGIANDSLVLGVYCNSLSSLLAANLWASGFDYNPSSGYFEFDWVGGFSDEQPHMMNIICNPTDWNLQQYNEFDEPISLFFQALSVSGWVDPEHHSALFVFPTGDSGPGYGTATPPSARSILQVGASTNWQSYESLYGPDQGFDQVADFSSRGPLASGFVKPDVLAPGMGYTIHPNYGEFIYRNYAADHYGTHDYQLVSGTGVACSVAAGVAALLYEAYYDHNGNKMSPGNARRYIQTTAVDLGYDAFTQGHGRIDAYSVVRLTIGVSGYYTFFSMDSGTNYASVMNSSWNSHMRPYDEEVLFDDIQRLWEQDSSLYFGWVEPGETVSMTMMGYTSDWSSVGYPAYDMAAVHYTEQNLFHDVWTTHTYQESTSTGSPVTREGYQILQSVMGTDYDTFINSRYATILISGNQDSFAGTDSWAAVFDWVDDDPTNGVPDFYSGSAGDELTRVQYGEMTKNVIKMDLAHPDGIGNLFTDEPIIMIHDGENPNIGGNDLEVTIISWGLQTDSEIILAAGGDTDETNITLNVSLDAEIGVHQGFINVSGLRMVPYSYVVKTVIDSPHGEGIVVGSGYGSDWNPYENSYVSIPSNGMLTTNTGDHQSYILEVTRPSADYLGVILEWFGQDNDFDVSIFESDGSFLGSSVSAVKTTDSATAKMVALPADPVGDYIIIVRTNQISEATNPAPFTLKFYLYDYLPGHTFNGDWTSNDSPTPETLASDITMVGDHVTINTEFSEANLPNMSYYEVLRTTITAFTGQNVFRFGSTAIDYGNNWPFDPTLTDSYSTEILTDIEAGETVKLELALGNQYSDSTLIVYEYLGVPLTGSDLPIITLDTKGINEGEIGSFVAAHDMDIICCIYSLPYTEVVHDSYQLHVDTTTGETFSEDSRDVSFDTYNFGLNGTYAISVVGYTGCGIYYSYQYTSVAIQNYFAPSLENITIVTDEEEIIASWTVNDRNAHESHYFEVLLSSDGGATYEVLIQPSDQGTQTYFVWNCTGYEERSDYVFKIRCWDNDPYLNPNPSSTGYWPGLYTEATTNQFSAGIGATTTTTTTTGPFGSDILIWVITSVGVVILVVIVVVYLKKRK